MAGETGKLNRRHFVAAAAVVPMLSACAASGRGIFENELAVLERRSGGRLGVQIHDTSNGRSIGYRQNERFAMCSTFKTALAAFILREGEAGRIDLQQWHEFEEADLELSWASTRAILDRGGMTILRMAETAQKTSDNGCTNILLRILGGPPGFTARLRAIGDNITRLDRYEPVMNFVGPGESRDTTTPFAMARTLQHILLDNVLNSSNRALLIDWMEKTETGLKRIRAGLPAGWRAGDKTGTGANYSDKKLANKYNDIAIVWPPGRPPIIVSVYFDGPGPFADIRDEDQAVLAEVGRIAAKWAAS